MTAIQTIPDIEAVIGTYLREHGSIVALGAKVMGRSPSKSTTPWVKFAQIDATDVGGVEHLIDYLLQFDCYAGKAAMDAYVGQSEASLLGRTVRAVLWSARGQTLDGGDDPDVVVSSVTFQGMPRIPDPDFEPDRERYILTATIHAHG